MKSTVNTPWSLPPDALKASLQYPSCTLALTVVRCDPIRRHASHHMTADAAVMTAATEMALQRCANLYLKPAHSTRKWPFCTVHINSWLSPRMFYPTNELEISYLMLSSLLPLRRLMTLYKKEYKRMAHLVGYSARLPLSSFHRALHRMVQFGYGYGSVCYSYQLTKAME